MKNGGLGSKAAARESVALNLVSLPNKIPLVTSEEVNFRASQLLLTHTTIVIAARWTAQTTLYRKYMSGLSC